MTRRDIRRILSDLSGVDHEQDAGIEVQLHARTAGTNGTHTVKTVRIKDLTQALAELVERQSKEAVHRAQERAHRAEIAVTELQLAARKEREMSEVNIAATGHEGNTVAERGETVSLHERLWRAATGTIMNSDGEFWRIPEDRLAAIQEAIEAPWRERVAELEVARLADTEVFAREHDALKARADALRDVCLIAQKHIGNMPRLYGHIAGAVRAYDAADRAGETQAAGFEAVVEAWRDDGETQDECVRGSDEYHTVGQDVDGAHDRRHVGGVARNGQGDRPEASVVPEGGDTSRTLRSRGEQAEAGGPEGGHRSGSSADGGDLGSKASSVAAPSPTDAAAEGDDIAQVNQWCIDLVDIARDDILKLINQVTDLQRWREGVDEWQDDADSWRRRVDANMEHLTYSTEHLILRHQREDGLLNDLEQRLDALRGPEVTVTDEMFAAFDRAWNENMPRHGNANITWDDEERRAIRAGLEAALRVGGAK